MQPTNGRFYARVERRKSQRGLGQFSDSVDQARTEPVQPRFIWCWSAGEVRRVDIVLRTQAVDQEGIIRAIDVNGLKPVIDRVVALEQIAAAFGHSQTKDRFGKIDERETQFLQLDPPLDFLHGRRRTDKLVLLGAILRDADAQ